MRKLNLNKQKVVSLTDVQMQQINGGGEKRSDRKTGDCAFSRKHGETESMVDGEFVAIGCYPKSGN